MNAPVRLFAAAKQIAGSDLVTLELSNKATLAELRAALLILTSCHSTGFIGIVY